MGSLTDAFGNLVCFVLLSILASLCFVTQAHAYVGDSFLSVSGVAGHPQEKHYKRWIRVEASYWGIGLDARLLSRNYDNDDRMVFSAPGAPKPGAAGRLAVSMNKRSADVAALLELCRQHRVVPEVGYAESSDRTRLALELAQRPPSVPEYWEYRLKDVQVSDCPAVADAEDQAFVLSFKDIDWLNYDAKGPDPIKVPIKMGDLPDIHPAKDPAKVKTFVITWIAPATEVSDEQCPVINKAPSEDDYYRYMSQEAADKERIENAKHGGVSFGGLNKPPQMDWRGPDKLNADQLPGIVPDPGHAEPQSDRAFGLDLDGNDGSGHTPSGICPHKNYLSEDGKRQGIDNQLFRVMGCIAGFRGRKGYLNQTSNKHRADGEVTTLIEINGLEDGRKSRKLEVTILYSRDLVGRDLGGKRFIPNFTFRTTSQPAFAMYATRLRARMVDGVIETEPAKQLLMNMGIGGLLTMQDGRLRLQVLPDGNLHGVMGGYVDWRKIMNANSASYGEQFFGFQSPALYHSLKRNADGMKNPVTGECDAISAAYEIDAIPAFVTQPAPVTAQLLQKGRDVAPPEAEVKSR